MHKIRTMYLIVLILGWALSFGAYPSWGYYPPFQASGSSTSNSVTYTVYNPQVQQGYTASLNTLGTVVNFQQHNGGIAWVVKDGTNYSVEWVTFDTALNTFQNGWQGPLSMVAHFQVRDGVVAYSFLDFSGNPGCGYATYDPAKGAWQKKSYLPFAGMGYDVLFVSVDTKDGVLVFSYRWSISGMATSTLRADMYDSALGKWFSEQSSYGPEVIFNDGYLTCQSIITNSTIYTTIYHPTLGAIGSDTWGYNPGNHQWYHGVTKPLAYFVAQPDFGKKPLWVWFTDMSIAGANWNWDFKDGNTSTSRSPCHTFAATGVYPVSLQINGPGTFSRTVTVVTSFTLKNKSLPAVLPLLLLPD